MNSPATQSLVREMQGLKWYHTIHLGHDVRTPGIYDHGPYLGAYGLPRDLRGKTALDLGAASGFFTFELEKRGAAVTATDLPTWAAHDFGPLYQHDMMPEQAHQYLHDPFLFAHKALGSSAKRKEINIYDVSPQTVGVFDLVFCGSVLVHLTDPAKALWRIRSVTKEAAIIATSLYPLQSSQPLAAFVGQERGDAWWLPNRAALEAMVKAAGFQGWEWFSEFRLDFRDGQPGPYHGVVRAWNTSERPALLDSTDQPPLHLSGRMTLDLPEVQTLKAQLAHYEQAKAVRLVRWLDAIRQKVRRGER